MSDLPSWCRVGARVVCVDAHSCLPGCIQNLAGLEEGGVYTISGLAAHFITGDVGVHLAGISRPVLLGDPAPQPFGIYRFRPAVEDSDDNGIEAQLYRNKHLHHRAPEGADA